MPQRGSVPPYRSLPRRLHRADARSPRHSCGLGFGANALQRRSGSTKPVRYRWGTGGSSNTMPASTEYAKYLIRVCKPVGDGLLGPLSKCNHSRVNCDGLKTPRIRAFKDCLRNIMLRRIQRLGRDEATMIVQAAAPLTTSRMNRKGCWS